jgi:hypothetical protein
MARTVSTKTTHGESLAEEMSVLGPKSEQCSEIALQSDNTTNYVAGFKLAMVVGSMALACFLMLLDTMVISTVRGPF